MGGAQPRAGVAEAALSGRGVGWRAEEWFCFLGVAVSGKPEHPNSGFG